MPRKPKNGPGAKSPPKQRPKPPARVGVHRIGKPYPGLKR
jgi:hypothetical protein